MAVLPQLPASDQRWIRDVEKRVEKIERRVPKAPDYIAPTLLGTWTNFGGAYETAGYTITEHGIVLLRGLVVPGAGGYGTNVFTLPVGYRPALEGIYCCVSFTGIAYGFGDARVQANGNIFAVAGGAAWISLAGITFRAA